MARPLRITANVLVLAMLAFALHLSGSEAKRADRQIDPGEKATVFGVGSTGLAVRDGPGFRFPAFAVIPEGAEVIVLDGPTWSGQVPWYLITGYDTIGSEGWASGNYLQLEQEETSDEMISDETEEGDEPERVASARGTRGDGRSFIAMVTAYSLSGRTASGRHTEWGIVAVDPSVIPLGSELQIDGFEEVFLAADTGGAVKGAVIDIWFPSYAEARRFGTQSRRVTIIDP